MLTNELLKKEVYAVALNGRTLFYAPLTRSFAVLDGICSLANITGKEWFKEAVSMANVPDFVREKGFVCDEKKIRLRLNITTKCNLECSYCSVKAGDNPISMSEKIAISAVSGFCKFAEKNKAKILELVFSGGEPTLCVPLIEKCIARARSQLASYISFQPRLLTNGLFNQDQCKEVIRGMKEIQVSWDGFFGISQRYGSNYRTASRVWGNIRFIVENDVPISVLIVVSEMNFLRIREIVDQLYERGVRHIFLGLRESLGRVSNKMLEIDYETLGSIYYELWKDYRLIGLDINLTGTDIHSVSPFPCSVPIPNYSVSPGGVISACTVSFNDRSVKAKVFEIGAVYKENVFIDPASLIRVRKFHILNIHECDHCFAKWHCRGGCAYAKNGDWFAPFQRQRCKMIKEIIAKKLMFVAEEQRLS